MAIKEEAGEQIASSFLCGRVGQPSDSRAELHLPVVPGEDMHHEAPGKIRENPEFTPAEKKDITPRREGNLSTGADAGTGPPKKLFEELPQCSRVGQPSDSTAKRPREDEPDDEEVGQGNKKKKRRGKARCRPGANERRWTALEGAQRDAQ